MKRIFPILITVLGLGLGVAMSLERSTEALAVEKTVRSASADGAVLQVGFDPKCLATGNDILLSLAASPISCSPTEPNGRCDGFEKIVTIPKQAGIREQMMLGSVAINLAELSESIGTSPANMIVAVSVCKGLDAKGHCNVPALYQALRMNGRNLEAAASEGKLSLELVADARGACPQK